jgi:hypothetical protein
MSGEGAVVLRDAAQKRASFRMQRTSPAAKETSLRKRKKEQGGKPCSKNCVDPISPKIWI